MGSSGPTGATGPTGSSFTSNAADFYVLGTPSTYEPAGTIEFATTNVAIGSGIGLNFEGPTGTVGLSGPGVWQVTFQIGATGGGQVGLYGGTVPTAQALLPNTTVASTSSIVGSSIVLSDSDQYYISVQNTGASDIHVYPGVTASNHLVILQLSN